MKNIYVVGVPRSGKSSLSKLIKEKYPSYNYISFEVVRNSFIDSFPELGMDNRNSDVRKNVLPKYITSLASWNKKILSIPSLVEGSFCSLESLLNLVDNDDFVICLGFSSRNIDEIITEIQKHDTDRDYTKDWTFERLKAHFHDLEDNDRENYEFAKNNNIRYYDTFINRSDVFKKIIEDIEKVNI